MLSLGLKMRSEPIITSYERTNQRTETITRGFYLLVTITFPIVYVIQSLTAPLLAYFSGTYSMESWKTVYVVL